MVSSLERSFVIAREMKSFSLAMLVILVGMFSFGTLTLSAAPNRGQYYQDDKAIAIQEMRDSIEDVRHQVNNHEAEIRISDEKLKNFDTIIESLRDELNGAGKSYKEQLKASSLSLDNKINSLETISTGLMADLRQFKTHSNETNIALTQYQQRIGELEKSVERQNQNIEHLQAAIGSLMEALQGGKKTPGKTSIESRAPPSNTTSYVTSSGDRSYVVKAGDSLEKIARAHQTTIQALKTANRLTSDRIIVGKTLIIPEK